MIDENKLTENTDYKSESSVIMGYDTVSYKSSRPSRKCTPHDYRSCAMLLASNPFSSSSFVEASTTRSSLVSTSSLEL